mmetsp:Transcript_11905/g.17704  ORF Transcript_11905/g.17704 Transcript_11905/m.17704 type:complete len:204 (-) Transcript_11905:257-868(-)
MVILCGNRFEMSGCCVLMYSSCSGFIFPFFIRKRFKSRYLHVFVSLFLNPKDSASSVIGYLWSSRSSCKYVSYRGCSNPNRCPGFFSYFFFFFLLLVDDDMVDDPVVFFFMDTGCPDSAVVASIPPILLKFMPCMFIMFIPCPMLFSWCPICGFACVIKFIMDKFGCIPMMPCALAFIFVLFGFNCNVCCGYIWFANMKFCLL